MKIYQVTPVTLKNGDPDKVCVYCAEYFQNEVDARICAGNFKAWGMAAVIKTIEVK